MILVLLCAAMLVSVAACGTAEPEQTTAASTEQTTEAPKTEQTVKSNKKDPAEIKKLDWKLTGNVFDDRFLGYISQAKDGNYMVSPLSFRYALGLLLSGAVGETKTELLNALGVTSDSEWTEYCVAFNAFADMFKSDAESDMELYKSWKAEGWIQEDVPSVLRELSVANSIWKRNDITVDFADAYKKTVAEKYNSEYYTFTPEDAVEKINSWANDKTKGMIPELLPAEYDPSGLALVLMNALYFKDSWVESFPAYATAEDVFKCADGTETKKDYMYQTDKFDYYSDNGTQLAVLPMNGGVNMAFVLGDSSDALKKISKAERREVSLKIPKLDIETSFDNGELVDFLKAYGVSLAFDPDLADFSGMIDWPVYVDDIIHKTRIKTDEDGVEAAAVTAIMMCETTAIEDREEPVEFFADRPFSFIIYTSDDVSPVILFAGEVRK